MPAAVAPEGIGVVRLLSRRPASPDRGATRHAVQSLYGCSVVVVAGVLLVVLSTGKLLLTIAVCFTCTYC